MEYSTIVPMRVSGTEHLIERTYRESGPYQWVRETYINAVEAHASRIEFGIEWQAVASRGVYRRTIADNGTGMDAVELVGFFNTFGGGGKPIGGEHENFGVGSKTSLFPWNKQGLVVVSWKDGIPAMIWAHQDTKSGEYGLRVFHATDDETDEISLEHVIEPFDDEISGCDWSTIKPSWIDQHGTIIVLLGDDMSQHTVLGDPKRSEKELKGISSYLNKRIWEIPKELEVHVEELRVQERADWPRSEEEAHGPQNDFGPDRRTNRRRILGAKHHIEYDRPNAKGELAGAGVLTLEDRTRVHWFLWSGDRPHVGSYAAENGFIAALYGNVLYDVTSHSSSYRTFGVTEAVVRKNLWIVLEPPILNSEGHGVYPRTDRNALLIKGGPTAGAPLPMQDWGAEFADNMPDKILEALRAARGGLTGSITDDAWREKLADRFGSLWRLMRLRTKPGGSLLVEPISKGTVPLLDKIVRKPRLKPVSKGGEGGRGGLLSIGRDKGPQPAAMSKMSGGIPTYKLVRGTDLGDDDKMLAVWMKNDPEHPEGVVLINFEHPMLEAEVHRWQSMYADHLAEKVREEVLAVYGEIAVAKVAHSEHLKGHIPTQVIENELRSPAALTMSLLGLVAEEAVLSTRIGGKLGKRRTAA